MTRPIIRSGTISIDLVPRPGEGRWGAGVMQAFAEREQMIAMLSQADTGDAIGAALSFLLSEAEARPHVLRAVLRAQVEKVGERRCDVIDVLTRVSGKG